MNTIKIAVIAMMGMSLGVSAQERQTLSGETPLFFTSTGTGTYDKTVFYHNNSNGFHLELAKHSNSNNSKPIDFSINARGGTHPFFTIKGAHGSVGIGTNSPHSLLHLLHPLEANLRLESSGIGGDRAAIRLLKGNGGGLVFGVENRDFLFRSGTNSIAASGNDLMIVKNNGNVGIGTKKPNTKLDVNGDVKASSYSVISTDYNSRLNSNMLQFSRNGFSYIDNKNPNGSIAI